MNAFVVPGVVSGVGSLLAALVLTPIIIRLAIASGLVDRPHARKVHRSPVPRIGGIAIGIAALAALAVAVLISRPQALSDLVKFGSGVPLVAGAAVMLLVGLADDAWDISSRYKLLAMLAASLAFCAAGGVIRQISVAGWPPLDLGLAAWPITVLWMVGITVSINFIDGLDGLAAGIVLITAGVLAVGAGVGHDLLSFLMALALAGSLMGFLAYNRHPAKTFMGDCGSMFIGFMLAGACVLAQRHVGSVRGMVLPAVTLSVPLGDTFFTMLRRGVLQRRSLFAAERGHVHHRLMDMGLCHAHTVLLLYLVTLAAAAVSMVGVFGNRWAALVAAGGFFFGLLMMFRAAGSVQARETLVAVRRNRAINREHRRYQAIFYDLQLRFREAHSMEAWWDQVCQAAERLGFAKLDLPLTKRDGSATVLRWRRTGGEPGVGVDSITAEVPVPQRRTTQALRAEVEVMGSELLESTGYRLALFSRLMGEFGLDRIPLSTGRSAESNPDQPTDGSAAGALPALLADEPTGPFAALRVALVHDFLYTYAGAERVLEQLIEVFPHADLFSLFDFLPPESRGFIRNKPVTSSFLQRMPFAKRKHRLYLPLMPLAIEQLDVSQYDLVISSSYVAAKGVLTRPDQLHICYCHTPVRFAWDLQNQYLGQTGLSSGLRSSLARMVLHYVRNWDVRSAYGVDLFITNSDFVGRRISKLYRRVSTTIYPPVDTTVFTVGEQKEDFYLTASRMVPYKRIDLIVEAFSRMPDRRLLVVGDGPEMEAIRAVAGKNITLLGHVSGEDLRRHLQLARAFVFAAEEDFGIAPVEAQACGTPVIAFARGGSVETIVPGVTGVFFEQQTVGDIVDAVQRFEAMDWDPAAIRSNAERFSPNVFREQITEFVRRGWADFKLRRVTGPQPSGLSRGAFDEDEIRERDPLAAVLHPHVHRLT